MSSDGHRHEWRTRYVTIRGVDCASGAVCRECGAALHQDVVEKAINTLQGIIDEPSLNPGGNDILQAQKILLPRLRAIQEGR